MPLRVVAGLPGSGITAYLVEATIRANADGRTTLFAVPDDTDAETIRSLVAPRAPVGPRVATLHGIVEAEWALRGDGRRLVRGLARDVLLSRALRSSGIAEEPRAGLVSLLSALTQRADSGDDGVSTGPGLARKLVEAVSIFRRSVRAAGLVEFADACAWLGECAAPARLIVIDGFRSIEPAEERLLLAWARSGADVFVSVEWMPGLAATESATPFVRRLETAGADIQILPDMDGERPPELQRVRTDLFSGPHPAAGSGAVRLVVSEGREAEARAIAAVVAERLAACSDPGRIIVAFPDPPRHEAWIRRAFRDAGIPTSVSVPVPVGEAPLGAALLALRECATNGTERARLGALMRGPYGGVAPEESDAADLAWRKSGMRTGSGLLRRAGAVARLVQEARSLADSAVDGVSSARWKDMADGLLANANPGAAVVAKSDALLDAAVHRAFCRALQEALDLSGADPVTAREFWDRFAGSSVRIPHAHGPAVRVVGLDEVAGEGLDHVVVGGLTASECPGNGSEDRLEGDAVAKAMLALGIPSEVDLHLREQRRSFFLAVAAARRSLTLVRCEADDEGAPLRESVFWDEFLDLYRVPGEALDLLPGPDLERFVSEGPDAAGRGRVHRGELASPESLATLASIEEVSPSEVETYVSCPYRWFVERRLRADSPDEEIDPAAVGRIAHEALARFYRDRVADGAGRVGAAESAAASALAERIAVEEVAAVAGAERLESLALLRSVPPAVAALVARDAGFLPGYRPALVEWSFGGRSEAPAVDVGGIRLKGRADRIDIGPEGLVVVDYKRTIASSLSRIRSKGLVQLQLYAAAASSALDLPVSGGLYRGMKDGADRGFILAQAAERGRFYAADVVDRDGIAEILATAVEIAVRAAGGMRSGRIEPTPSADACRYCAASSFCAEAVTG